LLDVGRLAGLGWRLRISLADGERSTYYWRVANYGSTRRRVWIPEGTVSEVEFFAGINSDVFDRLAATAPGWYHEIVAPGCKRNLTDVAYVWRLAESVAVDWTRSTRRCSSMASVAACITFRFTCMTATGAAGYSPQCGTR
jgi:hypothetical protein